MVIVLSQKKKFQNVINSNLTSKDPLKLKNNTNREIRIYFHHVKVLTFYLTQKVIQMDYSKREEGDIYSKIFT